MDSDVVSGAGEHTTHVTTSPARRKILDAVTSAAVIVSSGTFASLWTETVNRTGSAEIWEATDGPAGKRRKTNQSALLIVFTHTVAPPTGPRWRGPPRTSMPRGLRGGNLWVTS